MFQDNQIRGGRLSNYDLTTIIWGCTLPNNKYIVWTILGSRPNGYLPKTCKFLQVNHSTYKALTSYPIDLQVTYKLTIRTHTTHHTHHAYTHTSAHTYTHTYTCTYTHTHTHAQTHAHKLTHTHTHTLTYTHTHIQYTHIRTKL